MSKRRYEGEEFPEAKKTKLSDSNGDFAFSSVLYTQDDHYYTNTTTIVPAKPEENYQFPPRANAPPSNFGANLLVKKKLIQKKVAEFFYKFLKIKERIWVERRRIIEQKWFSSTNRGGRET